MSCPAIPPILSSVIAHIIAAVPARARATFLDLLLGAAATKGGHVTDAILAGGLSRGWSTYYWFLEQGRWSWLRVWAALLEVLTMLFSPAVWYAVIDDSVVERVSTEAPGSLMHHNHNAKPNRPKFLRGQGWLCLAAVIERNAVGAVPLLLRLVRRGSNRGKLRSAGLLLRLLGQRLGHVRLLLDAWFMRAWLIHRALAAGHTVIGCVRHDLALFDVPKSLRKRQRGRPRKYGARLTPARIAALPEHRDPLWQAGSRALPHLPGRCAVPAWAGGAGGMGGTGAPRPAR
jgi:DDE superfamily endonuclease